MVLLYAFFNLHAQNSSKQMCRIPEKTSLQHHFYERYCKNTCALAWHTVTWLIWLSTIFERDFIIVVVSNIEINMILIYMRTTVNSTLIEAKKHK